MSDDETTEPIVEEKVAEETTPVSEESAQAEEVPTEVETPEVVTETAPAQPAYKAKLVNQTEIKPGQTIRVHERIVDISPKGGERQRIQVFEGIVLGMKGAGITRTMTVRKISDGVSVEKIYPINSPVIAKIELVKTAKVRRAKLRFLLDLKERFKRKLKETYIKGK